MADKLVATLDKAGVRKISTDLWGVFFEDISYSGDGGLNSELVQNGAFEYNRADKPEWSNYTAWRKIVPAGSFAAFGVGETAPVAEENPHYAIAEIGKVSGEQTADSAVSRPIRPYPRRIRLVPPQLPLWKTSVSTAWCSAPARPTIFHLDPCPRQSAARASRTDWR